MFRQRKYFDLYGLAFAAVVSISAAFSLSPHIFSIAQMQGIVKRTISEIKFYPNTVIPPVRLHGLNVNGKTVKFSSMFEDGNKRLEKPVKPDEEFEEDDNFIEKTTFEVTNVSNKTIIWVRFMVHYYTRSGVSKRSLDAAFGVDYGRPVFVNKSINTWTLAPGQTATISIPQEILSDLRKFVNGLKEPIVRVGIYPAAIIFDDGWKWSGVSGKFFPAAAPRQSGQRRTDNRQVGLNYALNSKSQYPFGNAFMNGMSIGSPQLPCSINAYGFIPASGTMLGMKYQLPPGPSCDPGCFNTEGLESMTCNSYSCAGQRENWYNPDHPNPATSGTHTVVPTLFPLPCFDSSGAQCGSKFGCTAGTACGGSGCEYQGCPTGCTWNFNQCQCVDSSTGGTCSNSPVILDISGNGINLTNTAEGINFDLNGDGSPERISWTSTSSDDAWLALDLNGNGNIDSGVELFGNKTPQPDPSPGKERNGFLGLAEYDRKENGGNEDSMMDNRDYIFHFLRLWQDANHNGISESNELRPLPDLGVEVIDLEYKESNRVDQHGNQFKYRAKIKGARGTQVRRWAWDVWLVTQLQ